MTVEIPLSSGLVALVDAADVPAVTGYRWFPQRSPGTVYAQANTPTVNGKRTVIRMHRLILGAGRGEFVDHRNGNGLDNRRANLRLATRGENNRNVGVRRDNQTGYKGVYGTPYGRFRSEIHADGRRADLGTYLTAEDAAHAYNLVAHLAHGAYAYRNPLDAELVNDTRVRAVLREKAGQLADLVQDPRIVAELLGGASVTRLRKKAS